MSVRGGRGAQRLWVAGALILFLAPLVPVSEAQAPGDPWWGTSDRAKPTEGFAVRVPVVVENTFEHRLTDPFFAVEIDWGKLLVEAGWSNVTRNTALRPTGFTLDVESIRVVPYARGFTGGPRDGAATQPVPHRFYRDLFEGDRPRDFDPTNAAGTILFQHPGILSPGEKLYYYVYANPLEYTSTPPARFDPLESSPLDAFLWGTRGNVYYVYTPEQLGQASAKIASVNSVPTTVTVSAYEFSRYVPLASTQQFTNPFTLQSFGERNIPVTPGRLLRIEADRPIILTTRGDSSTNGVAETFGYIPGRSGSFADDFFNVYGWTDGGNGAGFVRAIKASPGSVTINGGAAPVTLTAANPVQNVRIPSNAWSTLLADGKFLLSMQTRTQQPTDQTPMALHTHQVPSTTGGPVGTGFFTFLQNDQGFLDLCPQANATVRIVDYSAGGDLQIHPQGKLPSVPPARLTDARFCEEIPVPRVADASHLYEIYSTKEANDPLAVAPVPLRLVVGAGAREDTSRTPSLNLTRGAVGQHYGGVGGVDYLIDDRVRVFGHYNGTRLTIHEERDRDGHIVVTNRTIALERDQVFDYPDARAPSDIVGRARFVATKPIAVASLDTATLTQREGGVILTSNIPYARYVPGRPAMPEITVGDLEFRGPLVGLRSQTKPLDAQDTLTTGPGSPVSYRLNVHNLGQWVGGADLPDTITISCSVPTGWTVAGCDKEVQLSSGSAHRLDVVVTPSEDDVNKLVPIQVTARSKAGGAPAVFTLRVYVSIVYGVGMWFDVEGGRKTIDPPIGLDPGETHRYDIVVKNTGSTLDTIAFSMDPVQGGWTQQLLLDGDPVTSVRLAGGESRTLEFVVTAPSTETARPNIVTIVGQSQASALAADVVNTATRIKPKVDLDLLLAPQTLLAAPNETAAFNLTLCNKGNDIFTIYLRQDSLLPEGWQANFSTERIGNELTLNRNPGCNDPRENITVQLFVTPPTTARAGDLASVKIAAEIDTGGAGGRVAGDEVSAVVVVRRIYDLATPAMTDLAVDPGSRVRFLLPLENRGNGQVGLELLAGAVEAKRVSPDGEGAIVADWRVTLEDGEIILGLDERTDLPLRIDVPRGVPPGLYDLTFTTRLSREATQNLTIPVDVRTLAQVDLEGDERVAFPPGRPVLIALVAVNQGNLDATFELAAATPPGWNASFTPQRVRLAPGERVDVALSLGAPQDATDGTHEVTLSATAEDRVPTERPLVVNLARPQLYLADVDASGALRPGELVLVTATVGNRGGISADNVSIAMMVDDRVVDNVLLSRIPVGSSTLATLSWVSTQRGGDVRLVIDPGQEIALAERGASSTEAEVAFGSILGVPGPGILLLVVALLAGTALRRRWRS